MALTEGTRVITFYQDEPEVFGIIEKCLVDDLYKVLLDNGKSVARHEHRLKVVKNDG